LEEVMKKTVFAVMAVLLLAAVSGLAGEGPRVGPPPLRVEAPTLRPSPYHVWVAGYWKWAGINYEWVEGRWVFVKSNKAWVPGTWEQVGNRWVWKAGSWKKIGTDKPKADKHKPKAEKPKKKK
jgi:hypothetical protein